MTSWPSNSTLHRLLDFAGLHFTTSERSGPFWQSMLHNFLSRPLSFLCWTTAMLFWLDFHQTPPEVWDLLVSDASWYHHREAQNHSPEHSRSPFLAGGMMFPPPSGISSISSSFSLPLSLLPLLACIYMNNAWDLVLGALPLSVCLFKINRFMYSPIVSRFG